MLERTDVCTEQPDRIDLFYFVGYLFFFKYLFHRTYIMVFDGLAEVQEARDLLFFERDVNF